MSGLDLEAIHTALADQIRAGIDSSGFTVTAFPSSVTRPCIEIWPDADYVGVASTMGPDGVADVRLRVRVFLSGANPESEWLVMARLLSYGTGHASSIFTAINADPSLGGKVDSAKALFGQWNPEDGTVDIPVPVMVRKEGANV